jgi:hypothetical protein
MGLWKSALKPNLHKKQSTTATEIQRTLGNERHGGRASEVGWRTAYVGQMQWSERQFLFGENVSDSKITQSVND